MSEDVASPSRFFQSNAAQGASGIALGMVGGTRAGALSPQGGLAGIPSTLEALLERLMQLDQRLEQVAGGLSGFIPQPVSDKVDNRDSDGLVAMIEGRLGVAFRITEAMSNRLDRVEGALGRR